MKRYFLCAMIALVFFSSAVPAAEPIPVTPPEPGLNFVFKIIFKRPKMNCERGFGICLLTSVYWGEYSNLNEPECCLASVSLNERNELSISVRESSITKYDGGSAIAYFKDKTSITIPDPYPLPEEALRALGTKVPLTIKPGTYPLVYEDGIYTVVLQL
jgi:hypothetical protein